MLEAGPKAVAWGEKGEVADCDAWAEPPSEELPDGLVDICANLFCAWQSSSWVGDDSYGAAME